MAQCIHKGCQNPPDRKGYCEWHYRRRVAAAAKARAYVEPMPPRAVYLSEFLYVIGITGNPYFKVGRSADPVKRMANLQCAIPIDLTLEAVFCVASSGAEQLEREAHRALAKRNVRGEWFRAEKAEIIAAVQGCASQIQTAILDPQAALVLCREAVAHSGASDEIIGFEAKLKRIRDAIRAA